MRLVYGVLSLAIGTAQPEARAGRERSRAMTRPSLDELVQRARRDRPAPGVLSAVARSLRVPFAAVPLAALVVPKSVAASVLVKAGLTRTALLSWGAGSAA